MMYFVVNAYPPKLLDVATSLELLNLIPNKTYEAPLRIMFSCSPANGLCWCG